MLALLCATSAHAQTTILREDFQNRAGTAPVRLNTYTGTTPAGVTYTASPVYLANCNGWVAKWNDPNTAPAANTQIADCFNVQVAWSGALQIPQALGVLNGQALTAAKENLALTAYSQGGTYDATDIEIQSSQVPLTPIPVGGSGRFVTFGVDAAAQNCAFAPSPLFQFYLLSPSNVETALGAVLNVCTDPRGVDLIVNNRDTNVQSVPVRAVRLLATASTLYTGGATIGVRMRNTAATAAGNDGGIDNLLILDVTPTLSKSAPLLTYVGQPKPLTFTITNTSGDNLAKIGWAFTDTLPAGVVVASPNGVTNTCGGTVTATAGSGSIQIANGNLPAGTAGGTPSTCTLTVNVVSNTAGSFSNGASNIGTSTGLNLPPAPAVMEWVQNRLTLTKISNAGTGTFQFTGNNGIANHSITTIATGAPGTVGAQQTLTVGSTAANTVITETVPAGWSMTGATCTGLAAGQSASFTGNTVTLPFAGLALQSGGRNVACTITNTQQPNFGTCDSRLWLEQSPGAPTPTTLYQIGTNANPLTFNAVGTSASIYNAVGYNPTDNYQYGLITNPAGNTLVRIGADGSAQAVGAVAGLPSAVYISGAFGTTGNILYVKDNTAAGTTIYAINMPTLTATPISLSTAINIADWAWVGGLLYGVTNGGQLVSVNPSTGAVTNIGAPNGLPAGFFGAMYGAPNGLYGSGNNPPSGFYKFDLSTGAATLISGAPGSSSNDGSNCPTANITFGADLQITKTNTPASGPNDLANDSYTPGTARSYTVVVTNAGPFGAANAVFTDPAITNFTLSSVTCGSPIGGGVCPSVANTTVALMQGSGIVIPSLPYSSNTASSVTFTVTGTIAAGATGALTNVAAVAVGAGTADATPGNNSATDTDAPAGTIVIVKDAVPDDAQDFAFTTTGTGLAAFSLDDDADGTLPNTRTFTGVEPGSYTVTESVTAAWTLTALSCSDPDAGTVINLANRLATIDVDSGETITCTYTNGRLPILRLHKALPLGRFGAADQFDLSISGTGGPANVTTAGSGTTATGVATLNPGAIGAAYTFTETAAAGANLANYASTYACTNALVGGQAPSGSATTFNLTAAAGDDLTCTFTNTRNPISDLVITKTNTPGVGPSDQAGDTVTRGATTIYTIAVTNNGPDTVTGAVLSDPAAGRSGLTCTAPPSCSGAACPAGLTLAQLEAGVALGALANGASVVVTLTCTIN
ncbi:beta strand repeat-containing protein [Lysobacter sp. Hz 25]|uniref:beta strand repeat-containing protein n=1 Tax=Lysobacter sp. Hz 25 TaxID=3383698 RepID=UPI0038D3CC75